MFHKQVLLLLLLEVATKESISMQDVKRNKLTSSRNEDSVSKFDLLLNPAKLRQAEIAIGRFLTKMAGPMAHPISLRTAPNDKDNLQSTIAQICNIVRKKLKDFARSLGLVNSVDLYEKYTRKTAASDDWFTEVLLQGSFLLGDLGNMVEEIWSAIDFNLRSHNVGLPRKKMLGKNMEFLGPIHRGTEFCSKLSECLRSLNDGKKTSQRTFELKRSLANLTRDSPNVTINRLRSRLEKLSSNETFLNNWLIFLCRFTVDRDESYNDCIKKLSLLDQCLSRDNSHRNVSKFRRSWLKQVENISTCKVYTLQDGSVDLRCKRNREIPRKVDDQVKFIYETFLNRRISARSPLSQATNQIGRILSQSAWGKEFARDLSGYAMIFHDGVKGVNKLSKFAKVDRKVINRYRRVSESLKEYKKGLLLETITTIKEVHQSILEFEKFLVSGIQIALNETWQSHIKILTLMTDWMDRLFKLHISNIENSSEEEESVSSVDSESSQPEESYENSSWDSSEDNDYEEIISNSVNSFVTFKKGRTNDRNESFASFMRSMSEIKTPNSSANTTIGYLADNILLVSMFMETIGFIATLSSL